MAIIEESSSDIASDFLDHSSAQRTYTEISLQATILKNHPDCSVTVVSYSNCELIDFAKAGHADICQDFSNGYSYQCHAKYEMPSQRTAKDGKFYYEYEFAKYDLAFAGMKYVVYEAHCWHGECDEVKYFVAHSKAPGIAQKVEEMIKVATEWTNRLDKEIWVFDEGHWDKDKQLFESVQRASWNSVVLPQKLKDGFLQDTAGFFDAEDIYNEFNIPWKRGVILHGPPGNGKTVSLKALMRSLAEKKPDPIPTLYVKSFFHMRQGSRFCISSIFRKARESAPCLLVLEDLDSLVDDNIRSYFLNEVDGIAANDGILIIGTTNHLDRLDPAIAKRPSRFDRKVPFTDPDDEHREEYALSWMRKLNKHPNLSISADDCKLIAELTDGFSIAYMQEAFIANIRIIMFAAQHEGEDDKDTRKKSFMECFESNVEILREQMVAAEEEEAAKEAKKAQKKAKKRKQG